MVKKKETTKQRVMRERKEFEASLKGMSKEEKIAANKARVAKYHPEPDLSTFTPAYRRAKIKIEFEKGLKNVWKSIVSVPMGGLKKR